MNEVQKTTDSIIAAFLLIIVVALVCAGIVYYYRGAGGSLERELEHIEQLNNQLASETRQLQAGIASHGAGIKTVRTSLGESRERIEHVYSDLEKAGNDADRAIKIIADCEKIIEAIKAQR